MKTIAFGIGLCGVLGVAYMAIADNSIRGPVRVVDGDTLQVGNSRVRLWGIDAPEKDQWCGQAPCGREATQMLQTLIGGKEVVCFPRDKDKYGRTVAVCWVYRLELNKAMVKTGHAVDYKRYSQGAYDKEQEHAKGFKLGIWATGFVEPERWRHTK